MGSFVLLGDVQTVFCSSPAYRRQSKATSEAFQNMCLMKLNKAEADPSVYNILYLSSPSCISVKNSSINVHYNVKMLSKQHFNI